MEVIPAIDIMEGRCVQLVGGMPETKVEYGTPVEIALKWEKLGARILHVVDLDAALGLGNNLAEVKKIKEATGLPINFGGGIRSIDYAVSALDCGVDRIILGTLLIDDLKAGFPALKKLSREYGSDRIIASVDSKGGFITVKGWTQKTRIKTTTLIEKSESLVWGFLYTNVDVEGQMKGVRMDAVKDVVGKSKKPVIVSGGITTIGDIKDIKAAGAWGVVLGKALYEGKLDLAESLREGL